MELKKYTSEIYKKLITDEELLRLLHYKPANRADDPLNPTKPNILTKPDKEKWDIIDDCIMTSSKTSDLEKSPKCRLFLYPHNRNSTNSNYLFSNQGFTFDVLTHHDFIDFRNEWICDRVNEILFGSRIDKLGKLLFKQGHPINSPKDYQGYRLIYEFVSENY